MKIIIAPDSFKGSLSSADVADSIESGIKKAIDADIVKLPMADGGEGTVDALISATGGNIYHAKVTGPLGENINAKYGILGDGRTGVVELAAASGLTLIPDDKRNPAYASTYGTGLLIKEALDKGISNLIICLGGSATNDGALGIMQALGVDFYDKSGKSLGQGGLELKKLDRIDASNLDKRLKKLDIQIACDVDNPLCGLNGASFVFGPQKGASMQMCGELDEALLNYAEVIKRQFGIDIDVPGAGAAGGAAGGLIAFTGAHLERGIEIVLKTLDFDDKIKDADIIITGEGKIDEQTAHGKTIFGIARHAALYKVPVIAIAGTIENGAKIMHQYNISSMFSIINRPLLLDDAIRNSYKLIESLSEELGYLIKALS